MKSSLCHLIWGGGIQGMHQSSVSGVLEYHSYWGLLRHSQRPHPLAFRINGSMVVAMCRIVHDDVMRIIKYSLEEMLSLDAAERALDFWLTTVEPFFGLPPRQKEIAVKVPPSLPTACPNQSSASPRRAPVRPKGGCTATCSG